MPISDFEDLMNDTITLEPFSSRDSYGKPIYGTAVTVENCRVTYKSFFMRRDDGSEIIAKGIVWLGEYRRVSVEDKITLPDGSTFSILMSDSFSDDEGPHHTKVIFG